MRPNVLVLFGTTDGQTAKVAAALADVLRSEGADAELVDAKRMREDTDPRRFAAVIVAASVHAGGYQRAVERWVSGHAAALRGRPNVFVSVCLGVLQRDPNVDAELARIVQRFSDKTGWEPSTVKIVAGALPYTRYNWIKRWVMRRISAKAHGDVDTTRDFEYTDWADLRRFGQQFYRRLGVPSAASVAS